MLTANQVYKKWETATEYKHANDLYELNRKLERFYAGDHWFGVPKSSLMKTTYNFVTRLVTQKVSSITAVPIAIKRRPDEMSADDDIVNKAVQVFEAMDKTNWERMKLDRTHQQVAIDAGVQGLGVSYYFWNPDIQTGNKYVASGDIDVEVIDSIDLYVANPNETDVQKQDWIIISMRKTIEKWKKMAKQMGISEDEIEMIKSDANTYESSFDKVQDSNESNTSKYATGLLYFEKKINEETGLQEVHSMLSVGEVTLKEENAIRLEHYPLALYPWEHRKRFIYGNSEIHWVIPNQIAVNKLESIRMSDTMRKGLSKLLFNKNMISSVTNEIGGIHPVNVPVGSQISNAMAYIQPASSGIDFDKSIQSALTRTQELKGLNENVTGATRPDNFSAMLSAQEAAQVPLENNKKGFYNYVEDESIILLDFYKNYYDVERVIKNEEGDEVNFTGTEFKDVYLKTAVDVGASTQRSEALGIEFLRGLFESGAITALQFVERMPQNMVPEQDKLEEELGGGDEIVQSRKAATMKLLMDWMATKPPEEQQAIVMQMQEIPENEQINHLLDMIAQEPMQQPQQQPQQQPLQ